MGRVRFWKLRATASEAGRGTRIERRIELAIVELVGLTKAYNGKPAVSQVNLKIASGEFFSLLGPSGCGKSTTLRMLAGFVAPDAGHILIDGDDIVDRPPEKRDIGIVFQNYAIFPHMNVADNIGFGLRMRKVDRATIERRVRRRAPAGRAGGIRAAVSEGAQRRRAAARGAGARSRHRAAHPPARRAAERARQDICAKR